MPAYVSLWNPSGSGWQDIPELVEQLDRGERVDHRFGVGRRKSIAIGSTLYILETGVEAGLRARGIALTEPYENVRLEEDDDRKHMEVVVRFLEIQRPDDPPRIPRNLLRSDPITNQMNWNLQGGGVEIPEPIADRIEVLWNSVQDGVQSDTYESTDVSGLEGELVVQIRVHRKRERSLRPEKLAQAMRQYNGQLICEVCRLNFTSKFGDKAKRMADVHHIRRLAEMTEAETTRLSDLAVVCPTCHRFIHSEIPLLSVAEAKSILVKMNDL